MNLQQYQEDTLKKFDEDYCNFEISERISITDMQNIKQFILSSLKGQLEVVGNEMEVSCIDDRLLGRTDEYLDGYNTSTERWREKRDEIITTLTGEINQLKQ